MNGNVSGKEITNGGVKAGGKIPGAGGADKASEFVKTVEAEANKAELAKLGEGDFELQFTKTDNNTVKVDLIDTSKQFNGGKNYTMDSATIDISGAAKEFEIAGITLQFDKAQLTSAT